MTDMEIIKLWCEKVDISLPYAKFLLKDIVGMSEKETEEILNKITPEVLVELYKNEE